MKTLALLLTILIVISFSHTFLDMKGKFREAKKLIASAKPYEKITDDYTKTLLIIGDSTGAGVGATHSEDSVSGLLAGEIGATYVENKSISGSTIEDLPAQIESVKLENYTYILIQIGGNNIMRFHNIDEDRKLFKQVLEALPNHENLISISAGNVGSATFFPWFMRPVYTKRTLKYHSMFEDIFVEHSGRYVNLFIPRKDDPFVKEPEVYLSPDGLHPSSTGYKLWFKKVKASLN